MLFAMKELAELTKRLGGKVQVAEKLEITIRYVDMILSGHKKPSKRLIKLIRIYLAS